MKELEQLRDQLAALTATVTKLQADRCPHLIARDERAHAEEIMRAGAAAREAAREAADALLPVREWVRLTSMKSPGPEMYAYGKRHSESGAYLGYMLQVPQGGTATVLADELAEAIASDWKLAQAMQDGEFTVAAMSHDECAQQEAQIRAAKRQP